MAWTCSRCGKENHDKKRFCADCEAPRVSDALVTDEGRRRSRRMLTVCIAASVAFAVITIVSGVAYKRWWNNRPEFAVRQLPAAIANRDLTEFRRQMDVDSVARGIVDDAFDIGIENIWRDRGPRGVAETGRIAEQLKGTAVTRVKTEIEEFVQAGGAIPETSGDARENRAWRAMRMFFESCAKSPKALIAEGDTCQVTTSGTDTQGRPVDFEIQVTRTPDGWRVMRILNARQIMEERLTSAEALEPGPPRS